MRSAEPHAAHPPTGVAHSPHSSTWLACHVAVYVGACGGRQEGACRGLARRGMQALDGRARSAAMAHAENRPSHAQAGSAPCLLLSVPPVAMPGSALAGAPSIIQELRLEMGTRIPHARGCELVTGRAGCHTSPPPQPPQHFAAHAVVWSRDHRRVRPPFRHVGTCSTPDCNAGWRVRGPLLYIAGPDLCVKKIILSGALGERPVAWVSFIPSGLLTPATWWRGRRGQGAEPSAGCAARAVCLLALAHACTVAAAPVFSRT